LASLARRTTARLAAGRQDGGSHEECCCYGCDLGPCRLHFVLLSSTLVRVAVQPCSSVRITSLGHERELLSARLQAAVWLGPASSADDNDVLHELTEAAAPVPGLVDGIRLSQHVRCGDPAAAASAATGIGLMS